MIDSVLLQLETTQFVIRKNNKIDGHKNTQGKGYSVVTDYCKSFRDNQKKLGFYFPIINIAKRKSGKGEFKRVLEIQVSLPKLIYGTNLFEVDNTDLDKIYNDIVFCLDKIGISTSVREMEQAVLKRVDFSKIIKLPDYLGKAGYIINKILRFNYIPRSDFSYKEFRDGREGVYIKFWNSTQDYTIYDKISEIVNKGYTNKERELISIYKENKNVRNALRFELSLQKKSSFEAFIRRRIDGPKNKNFILKDIFNIKLIRKILLDQFDKVFSQFNIGLVDLSEMEDNFFWAYLDNLDISQRKREQLYYWVNMTTKNGVKGAWEQINRDYKGGSVDRIKREVSLSLQETGTISRNTPNLIAFLRKEHENFEIIKPNRG